MQAAGLAVGGSRRYCSGFSIVMVNDGLSIALLTTTQQVRSRSRSRPNRPDVVLLMHGPNDVVDPTVIRRAGRCRRLPGCRAQPAGWSGVPQHGTELAGSRSADVSDPRIRALRTHGRGEGASVNILAQRRRVAEDNRRHIDGYTPYGGLPRSPRPCSPPSAPASSALDGGRPAGRGSPHTDVRRAGRGPRPPVAHAVASGEVVALLDGNGKTTTVCRMLAG